MDNAPPPTPPSNDTEQPPVNVEEPPQPPPPAQLQQQPATAPTPSPAQAIPSSAAPSVSEPPVSTPTPTPVPTPTPSTANPPQQPKEPRPQFQPQALGRGGGTRPPMPTFSHFHSVSGSSSPIMPPSVSGSIPRGGMAIGHPAHQQPPRAQQAGSVAFSSFGPTPSFSQPFGGLHPRGSVGGVPDQPSSSNTQKFQPRGSMSGIQTIGMVGSLSTAPQMRPGGLPMHGQPRPGQATVRSVTQPQGAQTVQQPWMSIQGKSAPAPRPQARPQGLQQRPNTQQKPTAQQRQQQNKQLQLQQQQLQQPQQPQQRQEQSEHQQQTPLPNQPTTNPSQQTAASKSQQTMPQQLVARSQVPAIQRSILPATGTTQPGSVTPMDASESGNQILSKRSIHELVSQVDPTEKLDPEVEDILVEIADDFIESITTVACSLAKHRKSNTLEAKDILLHLEKNWNITLPGFGGDEIKLYKKPFINDIHKDRLVAIRKSMVVPPEPTNVKGGSAAQAASNAKGHTAKAPPIGSPKLS